ncbi:DUF2388 domain-containing protein [Xanthomonas oryzae]|uniref:DUF2388 domain-containing protein n=1 Tax=Xanthomonas oryzae TaxID=347 RepID=UPI000467E0DD|nr:DUF2388 domain-containing protein [Xanthomonas oryzae]ALS95041.1 hypothetical protein AXO1947_11430 [Xanthomonas oryzae pv. oryzae]AUI90423.1 hypothetical protein BVV16_09975 [Xanthomonas oryzae pv. oryzae]AUI94098.1 hypothetical protein BVV17_09985 [Xanthomonas oryzae pv. oryzae]AUI97768.1 hypothetical protein BVV18_09990 [Xanthomonas oryzae pv. oryzae]AUJ01444.1 hypothetical protein BVV10_09995 [Xanthomonas oryzae pv. oryzae]
MMRSLVFCALPLLPLAAVASSVAGTSAGASSAGSSNSSGSSSGDDKVVVDAREDAAGFVASDGVIRGVRLEAALLQLRRRSDAARLSSDLELARSILAQ